MARIGINALYLIPGSVGGTEIYLRELLEALARVDLVNQYFVFTNLETGADLIPRQANFHRKVQTVHARFRPARILWEQIVLPLEMARYRLHVLFNPGFTAPALAHCPSVTLFHDLQHKHHPEHFRRLDLDRGAPFATADRGLRSYPCGPATLLSDPKRTRHRHPPRGRTMVLCMRPLAHRAVLVICLNAASTQESRAFASCIRAPASPRTLSAGRNARTSRKGRRDSDRRTESG